MHPSLDHTQETLRMMQDACATSTAATETEEKRRESRRPVSAKCELRLFHDLGLRTTSAKGEIRNISFRGMSIVAELPAPIPAARPIEVVVNISGLAKKHVAGTVAYCRKADRDCYELGLDVKAAGAAPILTRNVTAAQVIYDWFAAALKVPE